MNFPKRFWRWVSRLWREPTQHAVLTGSGADKLIHLAKLNAQYSFVVVPELIDHQNTIAYLCTCWLCSDAGDVRASGEGKCIVEGIISPDRALLMAKHRAKVAATLKLDLQFETLIVEGK